MALPEENWNLRLDFMYNLLSTLFSFCSPVVEYKIADMGHLKYYLAPKIEDQQDGS